MELDKTSIVLRQRSLLELIDLSLVVLRVYGPKLVQPAVLGLLPFFLINFFALRPMTDYDYLIGAGTIIVDEFPLRIRYSVFMFALIMLEAPLAYLGVTYWLGQAVFFEKPSIQEFGRVFLRLALAIVWILGIVRLTFLGILLSGIAARTDAWNPAFELFWLGTVLVGSVMMLRAFRPFAPELLTLEQTPLIARQQPSGETALNYRNRSGRLQRSVSGELFGQYFVMSFAMLCLLTSLTLGELFIGGVFFGTWTWGWWMEHILFPLNIWFVALWSCVFRLLSYLDCRTRLEGWELELRLKAEAARLTGAGGVATMLAIFLGAILVGNAVAAEEDLSKSQLNRGTNPKWFDAEKQEWTFPPTENIATGEHTIASRDKYLVEPLPTTTNWFTDWWYGNVGGMFDGVQDLFRLFVYLLLGLLFGLLVALIVYAIIKGTLNPFEWRKRDERVVKATVHDPAKIVDLPFTVDSPTGNLLEQAEAFRRAGDYGRSIIFLFGHVLVELDTHGLIHLQRGKTNRMYLRELKNDSELSRCHGYLIQVFEAVFFGRYPIKQEQCDRCWNLLPTFDKAVAEAVVARRVGTQPAKVADPSTVEPKIATSTICWLLTTTLVTGGCVQEKFPREAYGESKYGTSRTSLGGLGLVAAFLDESGFRTTEITTLGPRAYKCDTILWVPRNFRLPTEAEQNWFNDWLADGSGRTLIYVGRDYSPSSAYWKKAADTAQPVDRAAFRVRQAFADTELALLVDETETSECDWLRLDQRKTSMRAVSDFRGPWSSLLEDVPSHVFVRRALIPKTQSWKQTLNPDEKGLFETTKVAEGGTEVESINHGRPTIEYLLKSDAGEPLIWQMRYRHWNDARILVFANASFLSNEGMTAVGNRRIAAESMKGSRAKSRIAFLSNDGRIPIRSHGEAEDVSGFELLRIWPLSLISMHGLIVGFVAMLALWPIFGRPQRLPVASTADFGKHIEALGDLLYLSKDRHYALLRIADYFREVRGDLNGEWSKLPEEPIPTTGKVSRQAMPSEGSTLSDPDVAPKADAPVYVNPYSNQDDKPKTS